MVNVLRKVGLAHNVRVWMRRRSSLWTDKSADEVGGGSNQREHQRVNPPGYQL